MVKIKKNSLHAKLYRFFYGTDTMPQSLCPYFWKTVLAFLFLLPLVIVGAPFYVVKRFQKDPITEHAGMQFVNGLGCWLLAFLGASIFVAISALFLNYSKGSLGETMTIIGCFISVLVVALGLLYLNEKRKEKLDDLYYKGLIGYDERNRRKKLIRTRIGISHPSKWLVCRYIKAIYEKNCPRINWN